MGRSLHQVIDGAAEKFHSSRDPKAHSKAGNQFDTETNKPLGHVKNQFSSVKNIKELKEHNQSDQHSTVNQQLQYIYPASTTNPSIIIKTIPKFNINLPELKMRGHHP